MVTNLSDSGTAGSLRYAIAQANTHPGSDDVTFAPKLQGTITLTHGQLELTDMLGGTDIYAQHGPININANHASRVLQVDYGVYANLEYLTFTGGRDTSGFGGGGILNEGFLILNSCIITHNTAEVSGGGIQNNSGDLNVNNSTISYNAAMLNGHIGYGGGICSSSKDNALMLTMGFSTVADNSAGPVGATDGGYGGGIVLGTGMADITGCTFSGNGAHGAGAGSERDNAHRTGLNFRQ